MKSTLQSHLPSGRNVLWLATALCSITMVPAFAQDTATGRSFAALDEVIVTAQRREERLQDVPISMTVYNESQLKNRDVLSASDLAKFTPSLFTDDRFGPNNLNIAIRGFRQELRTSATVGVYFAEVVAPRGGNGGIPAGDGAAPGDFFDLQNVQVLKGPQGTLFGRNTTGGAILLVPQKPTDQFGGYVEVSGGNYDMHRFQGAVNVPINDRARLRAGVDYQQRDGYVRNLSGIGPRDFGNLEYLAARLSLVVDITDNVENYTIARYSKSEDHGPLPKVLGCSGAGLGYFACLQLNREQALGSGHYDVWNPVANPSTENESWQLINTTTWQVRDNLTVKSILSYSELTNSMTGALLGGVYPLGAIDVPYVVINTVAGRHMADQKNYTAEFRLEGSALDNRLDWQAGVYFERSKPNAYTNTLTPALVVCTDLVNLQCIDYLAAAFGRPVIGHVGSVSGAVDFRNLGIYGQGTYQLTSKLKVTAGLRYTDDKTWADAKIIGYRFFQPNTPTSYCLLTNLPGPDCSNGGTEKSDAVTGTLSFDFKPVDNVMLYAKYSRGYRQGSINYNIQPPLQVVGPEQVDTYETGAKTTFDGPVPGSINVALFYNDFRDQQVSVNAQSSLNLVPSTLAIVNAGKSEIKGMEFDGIVQLFKGFTLSGSYALVDSEVKELTLPTLPADSVYDTLVSPTSVGAPLAMSPKHKVALTGAYQLPIPAALGDLTVAATYTYTDDYTYTFGQFGTIPSVELWNLTLNWDSIGGSKVDLALFANNLADKKHFSTVFDQLGTGGLLAQMIAPPRMWGGRLSYRF